LESVQLDLAGRLKPGVTREQALAECRALWRPALEDWFARQPDSRPGDVEAELKRGMELDPLERGVSIVRDKFGDALRLLAAASGLLLLTVCANVAGLMLAGSAARRGEIAVRMALGATRGRLARQMLAESVLLAGAGAAAGWLLASLAAPLVARALPPIRDLATTPLAISLDTHPDWRVLLAALTATAITALAAGLAPALSASRMNLDAALRGFRASHRWRGRRALVVAQIALCTLLLTGAALLVRTFGQLRRVETGFDAAHVVTFTTDPGLTGYTQAQSRALWLSLAARTRDLPGVAQVAAAGRPLMRGSGMKTTVALPGQTPSAADFLNTSINSVTPEYFDTMGMRIVRGRGFTVADITASQPTPVVVNQTFAEHFFPGAEPLGQRFGNSPRTSRVIIGVVSDAKYRGLREPMTPTFYDVSDSGFSVLLVRTAAARPEDLVEPLRKALAALDPGLPFTEIHTLAQEVDASVTPERVTAVLAAIFGAFAAALAAAGIYSLLAFAVEQRRREIGIRMAVGAQPVQIGAMLGRQTALMLASGLALGLLAMVPLASVVRALLYGVTPADPLSLAAAAVLVSAIAAVATAIPARRATQVPPASALRE
jgi:predicted permease